LSELGSQSDRARLPSSRDKAAANPSIELARAAPRPAPNPPVYGSLDFDRDYVTGCHKLIKQLKLEDNVALRGLGAPIKVWAGGYMGGGG
jgi:hypothetical protein